MTFYMHTSLRLDHQLIRLEIGEMDETWRAETGITPHTVLIGPLSTVSLF